MKLKRNLLAERKHLRSRQESRELGLEVICVDQSLYEPHCAHARTHTHTHTPLLPGGALEGGDHHGDACSCRLWDPDGSAVLSPENVPRHLPLSVTWMRAHLMAGVLCHLLCSICKRGWEPTWLPQREMSVHKAGKPQTEEECAMVQCMDASALMTYIVSRLLFRLLLITNPSLILRLHKRQHNPTAG